MVTPNVVWVQDGLYHYCGVVNGERLLFCWGEGDEWSARFMGKTIYKELRSLDEAKEATIKSMVDLITILEGGRQ